MRLSLLASFFVGLLAAACSNPADSNTGQQPDAETQQQWLQRIVHFAAPLPDKADHSTKFDTVYKEFYAKQISRHRVDLIHQDAGSGDVFLLVSRLAPSLKVKRVGVGIHLRMEGDSITYYNEVFRTWKMEEEVLAQKGSLLFDLMVKGKDLSPYYPQNSGKEEYIEFPDEHTRFDTDKRAWVSDREDPLAPYYELKKGLEEEVQ